jgi:hypothetical protein
MMRPILVPGLLASGVGSLVFIGLDAWTGRGTFSLPIPDLPSFARPDLAQFAWAVVIGIAPPAWWPWSAGSASRCGLPSSDASS